MNKGNKILENKYKSDLPLSKNKNHFFIITAIILFIFMVFLSYSLLKNLGVITEGQKNQIKPKNVQQLIQVEVLNGCGVSGVGDKFTDLIRSKGFDVVKTGNYISFDVDNTFIVDRMGRDSVAFKVADSLGIDKKNIIIQKNKEYFLDLTIVIGKDFNKYIQKSRS